MLRYNHTQNSTIGGVGQFKLPMQETIQNQKNNTVQITETAVLGTKAVDETRFQFFDSHVDQTAPGNFSVPGLNVTSSFSSGGAPFSLNSTDSTLYEFQNILTSHPFGNHAVKVGGRLRQNDLSSETNRISTAPISSGPLAPPPGTYCLAGSANPLRWISIRRPRSCWPNMPISRSWRRLRPQPVYA